MEVDRDVLHCNESLINRAAWHVIRLYNTGADRKILNDAVDILRLALCLEEQPHEDNKTSVSTS